MVLRIKKVAYDPAGLGAIGGNLGTSRKRVRSRCKWGASCEGTELIFIPSPRPAVACRTTASARICPSCTRKCRFNKSPSRLRARVSMNRPEGLKSLTRETSRPEGDSQYTHTESTMEMREVRLREGPVITCVELTVFTQDRFECSRMVLPLAEREQTVDCYK